MNNATVYFQRATSAMGRNGTMKQTAISISECGNEINLEPVTSKGTIGNCRITIPAEDFETVVFVMKKLIKGKRNKKP
jgi:hypothetical protein